MSSLIPVHTPAAKNGRHIVFPYKSQGLSFSVKPLWVCSPPNTGWRYFGDGSDANDVFCSVQILYTGRVSEDAGPGLFILKISATDPDVGSNAQITYSLHGPGAEEFRLGPHTGEGRAQDAFILFFTHPREMQAPSMAQHKELFIPAVPS